jgi:hypothetical protein
LVARLVPVPEQWSAWQPLVELAQPWAPLLEERLGVVVELVQRKLPASRPRQLPGGRG